MKAILSVAYSPLLPDPSSEIAMKFSVTAALSGLILASSALAQEYRALYINAPETVTANENFSITLTNYVSLIDPVFMKNVSEDNVSIGNV